MSVSVTYYARLAGGHTADDPSGIVRRTHTVPPIDEAFGRDMQWHPSEYLRRYYLGHNDVDHVEIDEESAKSILDRWCAEWTEEDRASSGG
ncbi:hypothetical protein [Mycobacteroides abscessus]|uniref:hypothetical protein n=1 Tax=Mycobacteroides abscessus TaxID=36809 RepID=UPI00092CA3EF|nr:hypothetical protein [Mycobacteroides abscessus]SKT73504.1 Uncharacterised protein [Mycobacteroides abscessus subsp. abscessus]SHV28203.1 Uncharacterised protein [Mycobacteroides abscessus subsp. bolletii]SHX93387.1 Uncharacterised protein [Mycobacteroides abscessus subsp. bolletii]SHY03146.1 Uncharacterised protein [Mycobacteroides abscessus subsp. bolletii]SHY65942.1 Uncharacterised protein [Mycobacteroides abscessus subsp. bolletii]